jgi:hypothetical protein
MKRDGSHTNGFGATDGYSWGLFICHMLSSNNIIQKIPLLNYPKDSLTLELP